MFGLFSFLLGYLADCVVHHMRKILGLLDSFFDSVSDDLFRGNQTIESTRRGRLLNFRSSLNNRDLI